MTVHLRHWSVQDIAVDHALYCHFASLTTQHEKKNHVLDQLRIVLKSYNANELFCLKLRAWINILNHLFHNLDLRAQLFVQICITLLLIVTSNSS